MQHSHLSETVKIKTISEAATEGKFEIEGLYTGYGVTLGNALRRVLLSSLPGAAITQIKIKGVDHEFSTISGVLEDVVEITLNLKKIRFHFHASEPQVLSVKAKGEGKITAGDIKGNADVEIINRDAHIATLTGKSSEFEAEITVEKGMGYVSVEDRKTEKLPIKTIAIDAIFTPVQRVNFTVENMRVHDKTDYNRLTIEIETDGSITPSEAFHKSCQILKDHFDRMSSLEVWEGHKAKEADSPDEKKPASKKAKK